MGTQQISILLFDNCDLLDSGGPYEVFLTASRLAERDGDPIPFAVDMVTVDGHSVTAYGGVGLVPTAPPEILEQSDIVIVPGAIDLTDALDNSTLLAAVSAAIHNEDTVVASVCTGAFLLGAVGALGDRPWTTHWEDIDVLGGELGHEGATHGVRWVDSGAVITSGGLSSGIAMSLHLVRREAGEELAKRTAVQLDYDWTDRSLIGG